jgi:hypothetical protein
MNSAKKLDIAKQILRKGTMQVQLKTQNSQVPEWLKTKDTINLDFGYDLPIPIPDMEVDDAGIRGTLAFGSERCYVSVPWTSVYCLVGTADSRGMIWEEDRPRPTVKPKAARPSHLRLVK